MRMNLISSSLLGGGLSGLGFFVGGFLGSILGASIAIAIIIIRFEIIEEVRNR